MTTTPTPTGTSYRSQLHPAKAGFGRLLLAEWTKFRTVRAWPLVLALAAAVTVAVSQLGAAGSVTSGGPAVTLAPDGTVVTDGFHTAHRTLTGDGTVTVRVTGLKSADGGELEPWAKAGLILKESLKPGSPYAAVMATGDHGVRMQWDFTHDTSGGATDGPVWLRLTRGGDRVTGYMSHDGRDWTAIEAVRLAGLPDTVQVGAFVATPMHQVVQRSFGGTSQTAGGGEATGTFDHLTAEGAPAGARWASADVSGGIPSGPTAADARPGTTHVSASGTYTLTGRGDIAPDLTRGDTVQMSFQGVFVGVLFMVALGALFVTSEYKRGLLRTTFTATPARTKVLAAKALVLSAVTFAVALPATALGFTLAQSTLRDNGFTPPAFPDLSLLAEPALHAVVGSALLLTLVAVLALGTGVLLRTGAGAIAIVAVLVILPQILSLALPLPVAHWLLRATPAAAFAIEQGVTYPRFVDHNCIPGSGCYPLAPWHGLAVLAAYALAALLLAAWSLRRRDA
ncbi:hypothetical protein ABZ896_05460 [Streptomyces sp. NPDC047072]|uniref:hypothetical protein n=1 Tax=Streptomyces sp. NPDC047072 TaxID=3154809 RepID=UPI0033DB9D03